MNFHHLAYWQDKALSLAIENRLFINGEYRGRQKRRFSLFIFLAGWTDNLLNKIAGAGADIGVDPADIFTE